MSGEKQDVLTKRLKGAPSVSRADNALCAATGGNTLIDEGLIIGIVGRVRYGDATSVDAVLQALAKDYRRLGIKVLERLAGPFALAILDPQNHHALLAVDKVGIQQLYCRADGDGLSFCSALSPLAALSSAPPALDDQALYDYLYCHFVPSPRSIYEGIQKLPAGHVLEWRKGETRIAPYWLPDFQESPVDVQMAGREMLSIIESSVRADVAQAGADKSAAFLSGGLDSSTVTGMLARASKEAHAYSIGFDVPGYDEMAFARVARDHFGAHGHEYYVTPEDVTRWLPQVAMACDEPFGNSSVLPAFLCAQKAHEDGVELLLAGDGGDELFAGNERYAKQGVFEHFNRLPAWLQALAVKGSVPLARVPLARKVHSYIAQARVPLPDRMDTYAFLERHDPMDVFEEDFLGRVDPGEPRQIKRSLFAEPRNASKLNRMLYLDWHFTLHDNDLVKVNTACHLAGVEVAYPMVADDLVLLSTRIPSRDKLRGSQLRWFYKQGVRGFLPEAILAKKKHGFGLPFGIWLRDYAPLREMAYDSLSRMKTRGYIRPAFIDELISLHRNKHAAYYGELVWILMVLDLWLEGQQRR
ncbi:asparagine synthetase B family protein [Ectothiorhodospira variabilis]|uniref:asparagine synthetase B family protein n=1 Tax=Ectothiorhodospira variabilis TaxID=505694 RepID=UPI001EFBF3DE|nr:asparagine synthetase B [Ectothiorhodospira variabilis]